MPRLHQITPSLYQLSLGGVNAFILKDKDLTLIDTGYPGSTARIFSALRQSGQDPRAIKRIILTHAHPDHAGSAAALKQALGVPVLAHQVEAPLLEAGLSGHSPIHCSPGVANWLIYQLLIKGGAGTIEPLLIDQRLTHQEILPLAGGLQVLHTPGHSVGHIALWLKQEGVLIAGDACAHLVGLDLSTVYEDRALGWQSLLILAGLDFEKAVFGHGRPIQKRASYQFKARFKAFN
ncbi:MBL fold metallo-hydrolase [Spirosoma luteum]|uniref:MBL fold metallo-hydrolase n=1 Tax=Spirosoma luteum TaxID=431553 RepID=UPI00035D08C3|nr:MBL fold metallo-hydrolase [Spirosoma luteum]